MDIYEVKSYQRHLLPVTDNNRFEAPFIRIERIFIMFELFVIVGTV